MEVNYNIVKNRNIADLLILTVTDIETEVFLRHLSPISDEGVLTIKKDTRTYTIGKLGQFNVIHCRCGNMGTQEVQSSTLVTRNAIDDWKCVKAVIMVGIAFGMYNEDGDENKQKFSDVLVSSKVFPYENQKLKEGSVEYRGSWHNANDVLVDAFKQIADTWSTKNLDGENVAIEICPLLSGEKLVDDPAARNLLKEKFVEARGGEMEGIGLAASCQDANIPWILLKSICDFADGKKGVNKDAKQYNAAESASLALKSLLQRDDLLSPLMQQCKSNYFHKPDQEFAETVLFDNYSEQSEPYYYIRPIDEQLERFTQVKGCWVYGKSGVGKTIALQRALDRQGIKYSTIILATFIGSSIEKMFRYIYEEVCDSFEEEPNPAYTELHDISKALGCLVDKHVGKGDYYLLIEEIPLSNDGSKEFSDFVQKLCALIITNSIKGRTANIKFILSSISSPLDSIKGQQGKVITKMKFVEMPEWSVEDCKALWEIITKELNYELQDMTIEEFVTKMGNSPRNIKDCLRSLILLDNRIISEETLASL